MLTFPRPDNVSGDLLQDELVAAGVPIGVDDYFVDEDNVYFPSLEDEWAQQVQAVLAAHIGGESKEQVRRREIRSDVEAAWALLNDRTRWANLTAANRNEVIRMVLRALIRNAFRDRVQGVE